MIFKIGLIICVLSLNMFIVSCVQDDSSSSSTKEKAVQLPENIVYQNVEGLTVGEIFSLRWNKKTSAQSKTLPENLTKIAVPIDFEGVHIASIWWNDFVPHEDGEFVEPTWVDWNSTIISWDRQSRQSKKAHGRRF